MKQRGIATAVFALVLLAAGTGLAAQENVLYSFSFNTIGTDGAAPTGNLVFDKNGNLYGATSSGGSASDAGMIYELSPRSGGGWTETIIFPFTGGGSGSGPNGGLIFDANGNLYGTAGNVVFELSPPESGSTWTEQVLYTFSGETDASGPAGGLIFDKNGNLYGTSQSGGQFAAYGTVFELSPPQSGVTWTEKILHSFNNNFVDGYRPLGSLVFDASGNLYGTTSYGGANGQGTVFELTPGTGGVWTETILFNQAYSETPYANLIFDAQGNLYTTSFGGGAKNGSALNGTVFELSPPAGSTWSEQILHSFAQDATDGGSPAAGLIFDANGNLYSTTFHGGPYYYQGVTANTDGTIFELLPQSSGGWAEQVLYFFGTAANDGALPAGGVISDSKGDLYGVTGQGGAYGYGAVYEYTPVPTTPLPVFSLASGIYSPTQTVKITDSNTNAAIYYTLDGSTPTISSTPYAGEITVSSTETIQAIAVYTGLANSPVAFATYTIEATTAAPVFVPPGGSYGTAQMVSFTEGTAGAQIYYSTNGSTPTTLFTGSIPVSTTETIQAYAVLTGDLPSATVSATYTLPPQTATPVLSPVGGTYGPNQSVSITDSTAGAVIYYTTTGAPTTSSPVYSGPITLTASEVLRTIAKAPGDLQSSIAAAGYTITAGAKTAPTVMATPSAPSITPTQQLTVTVGVVGTSGDPTPTGTVTLTGGGYTSAATALSSGGAMIVVPAGSLATGQDALTISYSGDTNYLTALAMASVTVATAQPAVLTSPTPASTLPGPSVTFGWTTGSGASSYALWLGSTGVGSYNLYYSSGLTVTSVAVAHLPTNGSTIYARLITTIGGIQSHTDSTYTAATQSALTTPAPSGTLAGPNLTFGWTAAAGATNYQLWLGTTGVGSYNVFYSGPVTATSAAVAHLPTNGATVYARLITNYSGAQVSADYTYTATRTALTTPAPSGTLAGPNVTFSWLTAPGATGYQLWLGTTGAGSYNLYYQSTQAGTSASVAHIPTNGATIYAQLITHFGSVEVYNNYTYTAATQAALTTPAPAGTLLGPSVTFGWSAGTGATNYQLWLGSTGVGSYNIDYSGPLAGTSVAVTHLPTNGEKIYARLVTNYGGVQINADYTYTAATQSALTTPTPGSTFTGASETFDWTTAAGATNYQLWLGSTGAGSYNLYYSGPLTGTSTTVNRLPVNGETVYARLITNYSGVQVSTDYTYIAQ